MGSRSWVRQTVIASAVLAITLLGLGAPAASAGTGPVRTVRLPGETVPALARALATHRLRPVGTTAAALARPITVTLTLRRRDEAGFQRFLAAVRSPRSSRYRHFLTQRELADHFGPTAESYAATRSWLQAQGLRITQTSVNRLTISARGTRARMQTAFNTPIRSYRAGRSILYSNAQAPALPAWLAA